MGLAESLAKGSFGRRDGGVPPDPPEPDEDDTYDAESLGTAQDTLESADFSPDQAAALVRAMRAVCSAMKR